MGPRLLLKKTGLLSYLCKKTLNIFGLIFKCFVLFYIGILFSSFRNNDDRLAKVNAVFRTIDLATLSLAPLSFGLIFDFISNSAAAYFIAAWNIISVCLT